MNIKLFPIPIFDIIYMVCLYYTMFEGNQSKYVKLLHDIVIETQTRPILVKTHIKKVYFYAYGISKLKLTIKSLMWV